MKDARGGRLKWWQGTIALVVGGVGGQLASLIPIVIVAIALVVEIIGESGGGPLDPALVEARLQGVMTFGVLGPAVLLTGLTMTGVALLTPLLARVPVRRALGLRGAHWATFLVAPIGILALGPTSDGLRRFAQWIAPWATLGALDALDGLARSAPWYLIVPAMALIPGISEEILFRGAFQSSIRRPILALVLSAILFAGIHLDPHHVFAVIPLGFYLAWLRLRTQSTIVAMVAHTANNATAVAAVIVLGDEVAEDVFEWWWIPIGWVVCALTIAVIVWVTRKLPPEEMRVEPAPVPPPPATF